MVKELRALTPVDHVLELAGGTGIWTQERMRISLILSNFPLPSRKCYVITHFKKVISETGLPNIRFHDLRHTVATLLLSKEINPKIVQEQLGHSSINLTLNTYSHVIKSMRGIAANALEEVVGSD